MKLRKDVEFYRRLHGGGPPPPPLIQTAVKFATLRYIFAVFARITLKLGNLHYLMALFIAVLMNIRYCWLTKFQGKKRK